MTDWQHERLDISSNILAIGNHLSVSFDPDHEVLIAKLLFSCSSEYQVSWAFMKTYNGISATSAMVAEDTTRNLLSWKTVGGTPPGGGGHGDNFFYEWTPGLVLPKDDKLMLIAVQEATNQGAIVATLHITYHEEI